MRLNLIKFKSFLRAGLEYQLVILNGKRKSVNWCMKREN